MCIILGNLLDNSFNEAEAYYDANSSYDGFQISTKLLSSENFFVVYVSNTLLNFKDHKKEFNPEHGFGITNVQDIVRNYGRLYNQSIPESTYETTVSIPINVNNNETDSSMSTPKISEECDE